SSQSLLIKMVEGTIERSGKQRIMPPGKRPKLSPDDIARIKAWIDAGALPPSDPTALAKVLAYPKVAPTVTPRRPIHALAYSRLSSLLALGRDGEVDLISAETHLPVRTLAGAAGAVNALVFSADGTWLFAGGGDPGLAGEIQQWGVTNGALVRTFRGHK